MAENLRQRATATLGVVVVAAVHACAIAAIDIGVQPVATATAAAAAATVVDPFDTVADIVGLALAFAPGARWRTATTVALPEAAPAPAVVAGQAVASNAIAAQWIRTTLDRPPPGHALAVSVRHSARAQG